MYLRLPLLAFHSLKISRHSDPERSRMGRTAFAFAVAHFSTIKKIISGEAEILQFHPRLFSADKSAFFQLIARIHSMDASTVTPSTFQLSRFCQCQNW
jgi:hypothetical protein